MTYGEFKELGFPGIMPTENVLAQALFDRKIDVSEILNAYNHVLAFIDSLPEEKLSYVTDSPGDPGHPGEPGISDLEEAADEYSEKHGFRVPYDGSNNFYDEVDVKASKEGFIAGAKWKANQMPMPEDTVLFQKGVEEGRRLEKDDLALAWQDMAKIDAIILDVNNEFAVDHSKEIDRRKFYEEVLKRFKNFKNK